MWLWIALFTLPFMYRACRHALDALVEETLLFVAEVVRGGAPCSLAWPALARLAMPGHLHSRGCTCRVTPCPRDDPDASHACASCCLFAAS